MILSSVLLEERAWSTHYITWRDEVFMEPYSVAEPA